MKNLRSQKNKDRAEQDVTIEVSDIVPQLKQVMGYLNDARYKQAVRELNQLLEKNLLPLDQLVVLALRARCNLLWSNYSQAIDDVTDAWQLFLPRDLSLLKDVNWEDEYQRNDGYLEFMGSLLNMKGLGYLKLEKYEQAIHNFDWAIVLTPSPQFFLFLNRGLAHLQQDLVQAGEDLQLAFRLDPQNTLSLLNLPFTQDGEFKESNGQLCFVTSENSSPINKELKLPLEELMLWQESPHGQLA